MRITLYCSCGGAMVGDAHPDIKAQELSAVWLSIHSGIGHKLVDAKTSSRARSKNEDKELYEYES